MLRLHHPKCKDTKTYENLNPVMLVWIALAEYSQMSNHVPGFQSFSEVILYWPN